MLVTSGPSLIAAWLSRADAKGNRTSIMTPITWVLGVMLSALVLCARSGTPGWLLVALAVATGLVLVVALVVYTYAALTKPDLLRTEHFTLRKMEIQKGYFGDSRTGLHSGETSVPVLVANSRSGDEE